MDPIVKSQKIYAVIESTIEVPSVNLDSFLRQERFSGNVTFVYNQGGIRTIVTQEHIPITEPNLDRLLAMNGHK